MGNELYDYHPPWFTPVYRQFGDGWGYWRWEDRGLKGDSTPYDWFFIVGITAEIVACVAIAGTALHWFAV